MELLIDDIVQKHEHLDPILFENNTLKPDVKEELLSLFEEIQPGCYNNFPDVVIVGSRSSYYYHEHSDLDIAFLSERPLPHLPHSKETIMFRGLRLEYSVVPKDAFIHATRVGVYSLKTETWYHNHDCEMPNEERKQEAYRIYNRLKEEICNLDPKDVKQYMGLSDLEEVGKVDRRKMFTPYKPELPLDEVVKEASDNMGLGVQMFQVKLRIYNECPYSIFHPLVLATKLLVKNGYYEKLTGLRVNGQI